MSWPSMLNPLHLTVETALPFCPGNDTLTRLVAPAGRCAALTSLPRS